MSGIKATKGVLTLAQPPRESVEVPSPVKGSPQGFGCWLEAGETEAREIEAGEVEAREIEAGEVEAGEIEPKDEATGARVEGAEGAAIAAFPSKYARVPNAKRPAAVKRLECTLDKNIEPPSKLPATHNRSNNGTKRRVRVDDRVETEGRVEIEGGRLTIGY